TFKPAESNFHAAYYETNGTNEGRRLCFISPRITFAREQDGDRGAGAGGFADKRRVRSVYWQQRESVHYLCRSNGGQRDHHVHAADHQGTPSYPRFDGTFDDSPRRKSRSSDYQ